MRRRRSQRASAIGVLGQHHRRIPLEPHQLCPLHRRLPGRRVELFLIQRQDIRCERHRALAVRKRTRLERRILSQLLRKLHSPRANGLAVVSAVQCATITGGGAQRLNRSSMVCHAADSTLPADPEWDRDGSPSDRAVWRAESGQPLRRSAPRSHRGPASRRSMPGTETKSAECQA